MSAVGLESIDHTVQLTHIWINDLDARLGWENKQRSYRLLRTVLQAVRALAAGQRGSGFWSTAARAEIRRIYYEHWRPAATPVKQRHRADFVARIDSAFKTDPPLFTADAIMAVFELLSEKVAAGEIEKVRHALPADIRALWPHSSQAAWTATAEGV